MTMYEFNQTDLEPGSPRVLPVPLVAGAIHLNAAYDFTDDAEGMLDQLGVERAQPCSRWMVMVWDLRDGEDLVAKSAFKWTGKEVVLEGMMISEDYRALGLDSFMINTASALFGNIAVVMPDGQRRDVHDEEG